MPCAAPEPAAKGLRRLDDDLWVAESPLRFLGLEIGARMSVVRLSDGRLFLHSPVPPTPELFDAVRALGPVGYLVAPNRWHHLSIGAWARACPDASVFLAPGLETKRPDLRCDGLLGGAPEPGWADAIDQALLSGLPLLNEVVFLHRSSATLIACDIAFHVGPRAKPLTRWAFWLGGAYDRLGPTHLERFFVRDRALFRTALRRVFDWPFDRVIVAHGEVCEAGGRDALRDSYRWVL